MATRRDSRKASTPVVRLEPMNAGHIPEIMSIENASFDDAWVRDAFERELVNDFSRPHVALDNDDRVVGYVIYWVAGPEYHILNIAVRPDSRRAGVGRLLMNLVVADAIEAAAEFVALEVRPSNTPARSLYQRYGFATVGFRKSYYRDGESAEVMILNLRR
ncbi:MAG: ribosomal protein S18-alanine N-acetyltransferase [Deltaproteobacteria bacterium]|nr:ribosomal protein S18-alanine N-acetyltransferase [Deltaproteobacteria bacterium]